MKKKIIITVVVLLVIAGAATGGVFAYKSYQDKNLVADVVPVSNLNWGYWGDQMSSYGMVTNDMAQDIYLDSGQVVSEVFVEEGQSVAVGDQLLSYDITETELSLEMKKLEIQGIENDITLAKKELAEVRAMKPISETPQTPVITPPDPIVPEPEPSKLPEKTKNAYNYIKKGADPYAGDGSEEKPFRFLCTKESFVYGSYLNYLKKKSYTAVFEIREGNKKKGTLISSWTVNGAAMEDVDDDSEWSILERTQIEDEDPIDEPDEPIYEEPEEPEGFTAAELAKKIADLEGELKDLDLDKRSAELDMQELEKAVENGIVYATINGTVKTVGDPENLPNDGSAFLTVSGSDGLYVTGDISEMMLGEITEGQVITATSWDSGMTFSATITEISQYPKSGSNYYGEGNPNASYYPFTAYIEDTTGLTNGEYVDMSMTVGETTSGDDTICIEKAYVREENGRSYVYKAGEDNRLVKQYVETGKVVYGQAVIIKSGITMEDRLAFPYGKTAKEGVAVNDTDSVEY